MLRYQHHHATSEARRASRATSELRPTRVAVAEAVRRPGRGAPRDAGRVQGAVHGERRDRLQHACGYLNVEPFSFMRPIVVLIYAIGTGASAIAGEEGCH